MNKIIKTYKEWMNSDCKTLTDYLNPGDIVDNEMFEHFLNILFPLVWTSNFLQVSEPCDYLKGQNTYTTFAKENGYWVYKGECHKNKSENIMRNYSKL